jgi:cell division protein FtsW
MAREIHDLKPPWVADKLLLSITIFLVIFSLLMIYSATGVVSHERFGDALHFVKRQGVAAFLGFLCITVLARTPLSYLRALAPIGLLICVMLLGLTLIPGLGDASGGAQRWLNLGFIRFQPGEFVKLFFIIFMAGYFARHEESMESFWKGIAIPMCYVGVVSFLLLLQPDFGSSAIVAIVTLAMALACGARFSHIVYSGLALVAAATPLILYSPYRLARVLAFLNPLEDPSGRGYQLMQSLIAVGSGQVAGVGVGGSQQKLFFLPAAHTDFIYGLIAEELGFVGAVALLLAFLVILWRGFGTARRVAGSTFAFALAVGFTLLIVTPALLNMGVVLGLLPTKGLVLPLIGYGGTSLLASLIVIGLLLAVSRSFYLEGRN